MSNITAIEKQIEAAQRVIFRADVTRIQMKKAVARRDTLRTKLAIARNFAQAV